MQLLNPPPPAPLQRLGDYLFNEDQSRPNTINMTLQAYYDTCSYGKLR